MGDKRQVSITELQKVLQAEFPAQAGSDLAEIAKRFIHISKRLEVLGITEANVSTFCSDDALDRDCYRMAAEALAASLDVEVRFGDPRGFAVQIRLPSKRSNIALQGECWGF